MKVSGGEGGEVAQGTSAPGRTAAHAPPSHWDDADSLGVRVAVEEN